MAAIPARLDDCLPLFAAGDLVTTRLTLCGVACAVLSCDGLVSADRLTEAVLKPLCRMQGRFPDGAALLAAVQLPAADCVTLSTLADADLRLHSGFALLLAEGAGWTLAFGVQGFPTRGISEPDSEGNIYGAHEGFSEPVRVNLSLVRRRMKSPLMQFEFHTAGTVSKTELCICWLRDRVPDDLLDEIRQRIDSLPLETVLSSGYVRPFLEADDRQLVHSISVTERPDVFCAKLLEGRVGIFVDGTPFALVIPCLFCENFQTLDDYNYPPVYATFLRWLKYLAALGSLLLPGLYLAAALHHPELLHRDLLHILTESEETAPFSLTLEMLGVLFVFETVREAGLRLPKAVGSAVGMIGGLLIGDAAVQSGLISTPVLTVAATAATAGFLIPEQHAALTVLRPVFIAAASMFGIPGMALAGTALLQRICGTELFGFPITAPMAPLFPDRLRELLGRPGFRRLARGNFRVESIREKESRSDQNEQSPP